MGVITESIVWAILSRIINYNLSMTNLNYLLIGISFTVLIILVNFLFFVFLPVLISKYAKKTKDNYKL